MSAYEYGQEEGRRAYDAGLPCQPSRSAFINDAGAAMEYRDGFRKGWLDLQTLRGAAPSPYGDCKICGMPLNSNGDCGTSLDHNTPTALTVGTVVSALIGGREQTVRITDILDLEPPRFEADRVILTNNRNDYHYPEANDRVWGYTSDILAIIKQ